MIGGAMQKALFAALAVDPPIVGERVYDQVPAKPQFPYVTLGDEQVLDDGNSCADGWEVYSDLHVWSRSSQGSKLEVKDLAGRVVERVVNGPLVVNGFDVVSARLETLRVLRDPDGKTEHAVATVRHQLVPNS